MKNIHSNPTPLRQKFIEYLTLNRKVERTVYCYVSFIHSLAKHYRRSPDLLGLEEIDHWLYHLIAKRKQAPSTVNLAINAVRSFYGKNIAASSPRLLQSQRDCGLQPKVARNELPWENAPLATFTQPQRGDGA
jgi:hypothetical protein